VADRSDALETLVNRDFAPVARALSVALRDPELAELATRDALTRARSPRDRLRAREPTRQWVYVAAARAALRHGRTDSLRTEPVSEPQTLERMIDDLPRRERLALVLHHHARLSPHELARALRCSRVVAAATLHEAHRRLGIEADDDDLPVIDLDAP